MLTKKKLSKQKIILYTIVIVALFVMIGYILYGSFFGNVTIDLPLITDEKSQDINNIQNQDLGEFNENELNFLTDAKFKKLRNNSQELIIEQNVSNNPFTFQGE